MKNLLITLIATVLLLSVAVIQAQPVRGFLTQGDSIVVVNPEFGKVVEIFLVDSAGGTNDTVVVEVKNPINGNWIGVSFVDQATNTRVTNLIPTAINNGKLYEVPLSHPAELRLRRTDVAGLSEKLYYYVRVR